MAINTGLKNEQIITELLVSGSQIIDTKNDFGVYMFEEKETSDGIVFGKLQKPKYNEKEVIKSIDTNIVELLPLTAPQLPETVLKFIYDAKVAEVADLSEEIQQLNTEITGLEGTISGLETELETLKIEMDNKELLLAVSEDTAQQATSKVQSSIQELQNSIQRATAESIQRVSAYSRNESLKDQVDQYETQLQKATDQIQSANKQIESLNLANTALNGQIEANKASIRAFEIGLQQSRDELNRVRTTSNTSTPTPKSGKIICDLLYRQGFIPKHIWEADEAFGSMMLKTNKPVAIGYLMWAKGVVKFLKENPQYSKYVYIGVKPWSEHMAHMMGVLPTDNKVGKVLHWIGCQYSLITYNVFILKRQYKRNQLSLIWQ